MTRRRKTWKRRGRKRVHIKHSYKKRWRRRGSKKNRASTASSIIRYL